MVYRTIGALFIETDLIIVFAEFHENAGIWTFELKADNVYRGDSNSLIQRFIEEQDLQYTVALVTVHSEAPDKGINGASIAAETSLPVITDLSLLDKQLGGNGDFYPACLKRLQIHGGNPELNKAVCVAFMGVLRWREEYNFLSSDTGAKRSSIGGAIWSGQEA